MADSFIDREKGYEAKFKLDADRVFKVEAKRNKLLGFWLAEKYGLNAEKTESYAKEVIIADMDEPGVEDVIRKVMTDIQARGINITEAEIRQKINELDSLAMIEVEANE